MHMGTDTRRALRTIRGFVCLTAFLAALPAYAQTPEPTKAADWPAAMHAGLAQYLASSSETDFTMGPWLVTPPMAADSFAHMHIPAGDTPAAGGDLWTEAAYADGVPHDLPAADHANTYLYRRIHATAALTLRAEVGSDDGLQVWLNGEERWANDAARVLGNRDPVELPLRPGDNHLLLKIHNQTGGHGFFFQVTSDAARPLWEQIARDFPQEAAWFRRDVPGGDPVAWFSANYPPESMQQTLQNVLAEVSPASVLHESLRNLLQEDPRPDDPRWLALYHTTCLARELTSRFGTNRMAAVRRGVDDLAVSYPNLHDGPGSLATLAECERQIAAWHTASDTGQPPSLVEMNALEEQVSALLLANPLLDFDRLLLVKRRNSRLGLPQNWQGNCSVGGFGYDNEISVLSPVRPGGDLATLYRPERDAFVGDVDLHFDGTRMLVSMPGSHDRWQIWELPADGTPPRQVTPGKHGDVDNYDACYLPDGRIIFASTRCFQGVPCVGGADQVANLFQMQADGGGIRQLCFDQDHNWCPTVLENGRVLFTRWEYSDTPHYFSRLLFHMNPDGTNQVAYYGSNSYWPNSLFYARPVPGKPTQFIAIVSGHHGVPRLGELVLFDVAKGRFEADGVVQRIPGFGKKVEPVIADELVQQSWPRFLHPYPLSDKYFLVSCQPDPESEWGVYLADVFDNLTLLKEIPGYALFEPVPFRPAATPPAIPDKVRLDQDTATVYIADIYSGDGLRGIPRGTVKRLRVSEFHYAYNRTGGHEAIGMEGPWDVRRILGTAPVHEDGSALFEVPANTPIALHPLDAEGKAVQLMRSWLTAMPGETVSCTGCHEDQNSAPSLRPTLASRRTPDPLEPWHGPARGFSFPREVQPVLNRHCVACHDGAVPENGCALPDFSEKTEKGWGGFTPSYLALHPYVRRPGPESDYHLLRPMEYHADTSPLVQLLRKGHGGVEMDAESWDRLVTWIDLNVPDHGTWQEQCTIPDPMHERRLAMRTAHAGRPEDPERLADTPAPFAGLGQPERRAALPPPEIGGLNGWPMTAEDARALQQAGGEPTSKTVDLGNGVTMDLVLVPAGSFVMGDAEGPDDVRARSIVTIDAPFWMGATEVTLAQFRQFRPGHDQGYIDQQNKDHTRPGYAIDHPDMPVVRVTWEDARAFCGWVSEMAGLPFELPTEAQWEWACRAGADTPMNYRTPVSGDFAAHANLADASLNAMAVAGIDPQPIFDPHPHQAFLPKRGDVDDGHMLLAAVGQYTANAWGLHDMHGNATEWTLSAYRPYPYVAGDGRDDPNSSGRRVVRGGSWSDLPQWSTAAYRLDYAPWQAVHNVGFRVVCPVSPGTLVAESLNMTKGSYAR
jgi:formylglycine-generating enzyme required for sulfatase activity